MIVRLDDDENRHTDIGRYIAIIDRRSSKSAFLKAAKAHPGSYAQELMERIYDCLMPHALDVQEEYRKYYAIEYPSLEVFLYWKYNITRSTINRIMNNLKQEDVLVYGTVYAGGDYVTGQFIMSDTGVEMINQVFDQLREVDSEDQN